MGFIRKWEADRKQRVVCDAEKQQKSAHKAQNLNLNETEKHNGIDCTWSARPFHFLRHFALRVLNGPMYKRQQLNIFDHYSNQSNPYNISNRSSIAFLMVYPALLSIPLC